MSGRQLTIRIELALEDEPIGWIVRGEVSDELARFLDRWERGEAPPPPSAPAAGP